MRLILTLLIVTTLVYLPVFNVFFQHEEWGAFSGQMSNTAFPAFSPAVAHYVPFTRLGIQLYFRLFKLNARLYAAASLLSHLIIVLLIFKLASYLFSSKSLGFLTALFFALNASSHQATSWLVADINTHMSTIFAILSILVLVSKKKAWVSIIFLFIAMLFKETPIALFAILPFLTKKISSSVKIISGGVFYVVLRASMLFMPRPHVEDTLVTQSQSLMEIFQNVLSFPAKMMSQSLVPTRLLLSWARDLATRLPNSLAGIPGTTSFDIFAENVSLQVINWTIFISISGLGLYLLVKSKNKALKKIGLFGICFFLLNCFVYVLSPGRTGNIPVVDSRNLYLPLIGLSVFLVSVLVTFSKKNMARLYFVLIPLVVIHISWLHKELATLASVGSERESILSQIRSEHPKLPEKVVFYFESDRSFYGMPDSEKILPFQTNFGHTLMTWYWPTEIFPNSFGDQTKFLYRLTEENYKEDQGRGYGYFIHFESLQRAVSTYKLPLDSIIAYSYNSKTKQLTDVTKQTQQMLK